MFIISFLFPILANRPEFPVFSYVRLFHSAFPSLQEMVQDTLEGAMERLDLVLVECVHKYQSSLVLLSLSCSEQISREKSRETGLRGQPGMRLTKMNFYSSKR